MVRRSLADEHGVVDPDRRLPPQGGMPPGEVVDGPVVEIACDESGFSGTNLLDTATPVFTHASVDLDVDEALDVLRVLRAGRRRPVDELKSGELLRRRPVDDVLDRLFGELEGRAHVHVVDKEFFVVTRVIDLLVAEPGYAAGTRLSQANRADAVALHRAGSTDGAGWGRFLGAFVDLVRTKRRHEPDRGAFERLFGAREDLARSWAARGRDDEALAVLARLDRSRVWDVVGRLVAGDRSIPPPLEPLLPALAETVLYWSAGERRVFVVHDEQSALTADRLRRLQDALVGGDAPGGDRRPDPGAAHPVSPLAGLVTVDSRDDPRVQVADLLAGAARRADGHAADGRLAPFLSETSLRAPVP